MDVKPVAVTPQSNTPTSSEKLPGGGKFKNLSKKQLLMGIGVIFILGIVGAFIYLNQKAPTPETTIAEVGDTRIPRSFLNYELEYSKLSSGGSEKSLTEKIIADEIVLQEAKKSGRIDSVPNSPAMTKEEYLERTKTAVKMKKDILAVSDGIEGKIVSVWFNNGYIGPAGLEKSKEIALSKIQAVYERVKKKEITIDQAGKLIASDTSLAALDPAYDSNAITPFKGTKGQKITFWSDFDQRLWETPAGQTSVLYNNDVLYAFGVVNKKADGQNYSNFDEWLKQKRNEYKISLGKGSDIPALNVVSEVFAEDASPSPASSSSPQPSASSISSPSPTSSPASGATAPDWNGTVTSQTGAPIAGATVFLGSKCPDTESATTDSSGKYNIPAKPNLNSSCNPYDLRVTFSNFDCESKQISISNTIATQTNDFTCQQGSAASGPDPISWVPHRDFMMPVNEGFEQLITAEIGGESLSPTGLYTISYRFSESAYMQSSPGKAVSFPLTALLHKCIEGNGNDRDLYCWDLKYKTEFKTVTLNSGNNWSQVLTFTIQQDSPHACGAFQTDLYAPHTTTFDEDPNMRAAKVMRTGQTCPPPACNTACTEAADCARATDGCTQCLPNDAGTGNVCRTTPACNVACTKDGQCAGAKDGCTMCIGNVCKPSPACNTSCTNSSECARSTDGCTQCLPNDAGTGNVCRTTPACNVACTKDGQCAGAKDGCTVCMGGVCKPPPSCGSACATKADCANPKDGCSECAEGTCTDYNPNMCKCDGIVADLSYPSSAFKFEAFGKVTGGDVKKAEIADITFRMTKNEQTIAKSNPITPQIVENTADKIRFKGAWQTPPPPVDKNAVYQVFAEVRCKPKRIVADASLGQPATVAQEVKQLSTPIGARLIANLINQIGKYLGQGNDLISKDALAQLTTSPAPSPNVGDPNLQLRTLNFVKMLNTDGCRALMWKYDETLF